MLVTFTILITWHINGLICHWKIHNINTKSVPKLKTTRKSQTLLGRSGKVVIQNVHPPEHTPQQWPMAHGLGRWAVWITWATAPWALGKSRDAGRLLLLARYGQEQANSPRSWHRFTELSPQKETSHSLRWSSSVTFMKIPFDTYSSKSSVVLLNICSL